VAGLGFYLVGVPNAALWGTIMAIFAPVPYIGTAIIWGPVGIYNLINGEVFSGLFVLIWGVAVVATIDNIVKPYLIGRSTAINPLAILLTLLGGILLFGPSGLIYGPFLLTLLFGVLHIYELEYEEVLKD
jgi:predicted PurR-regulated permease PerM